MREIKFRAWDKERELMFNVCIDSLDGGLMPISGDWDQITHPFEDRYCELMQYTGLKDKNGKEIYEGDIMLIPDSFTVPITDDGAGPIEDFNHLVPVIYKGGTFGVEIPKSDYGETGWHSFESLEDTFGLDTLEIIGNIYENPGLLNSK